MMYSYKVTSRWAKGGESSAKAFSCKREKTCVESVVVRLDRCWSEKSGRPWTRSLRRYDDSR
jgi:hypothetical protein